MARVLVVGVMRSGKTTLAEALGAAAGLEVVEEPDNPLSRPYALRVKQALAQRYFPVLRPEEEAPEYELLWRFAFGADAKAPSGYSVAERARRRISGTLLRGAAPDDVLRAVSSSSPGAPLPLRLRTALALAVPERPVRPAEHVVVTANAPLSAEWVAQRLGAAVVVVVRDPLSVLSSWAQLDWLGGEGHDMLDELDPLAAEAAAAELGAEIPPPGSPPLVRAAWLLGLLTWRLRQAAARNSHWAVVRYEQLAEQPVELLAELAARLGLPHRAPGTEWPRADNAARSAGELEAVKDVDAGDVARAAAVLAAFPLDDWGRSGPEDAVADAALDPSHEPAQEHDELGQVGFRSRPRELDQPLDP